MKRKITLRTVYIALAMVLVMALSGCSSNPEDSLFEIEYLDPEDLEEDDEDWEDWDDEEEDW